MQFKREHVDISGHVIFLNNAVEENILFKKESEQILAGIERLGSLSISL